MNLATWSLRNPIPSVLLFCALGLTGVWGFAQLHVQNIPDVVLPTVNIDLTQPGAAPAQLESQVARKVEDSLANLQGLKHTETSITDGAVHVSVKFVLEKNRSDALIEVKDAVDRIRSQLPQELEPPRVSAPIALPDGRRLRLDQVAKVMDTDAQRTQVARLDGEPVVGFSVYRAVGQDEVALEEGVRAALERVAAANPGLVITNVADKMSYTREQYHGSMDMLYEGALLAILVVWWFLRDWRATLVAASALPLSIVPVFAAMQWLGLSLDTVTPLALAAVVRILVDDAIVEIENIVRHLRSGKPVREATADAVSEIGLAVVATTLTLAAVFVPSSLMKSVPGLFFREVGWTAALAVLASLLVARLLTPIMAAQWLKPAQAHDEEDSRLMRVYLRCARWCLSHRKTTVALSLLYFAV